MTDPVFVDTNVLVYAWDDSEVAKQPQAIGWRNYLWTSRRGRLSYQVLQEFYNCVTRKLKPGVPTGEARAEVRDLLAWQPVAMEGQVLERAWSLEDRYSLSWWDSLIVAAALQSGCAYLLSEDLPVDQRFDKCTVVSPFARKPGSF